MLEELLAGEGFEVERRVVPDEREAISGALAELSERVRLVLTTGGTGVGPRDVTPEATAAYIRHRLRVAGAKRDLFAPEALEAVHRHARGTPRLINTLCDNALLEGFLLKRERIDPEIIHGVARDLGVSPVPAAAPSDRR